MSFPLVTDQSIYVHTWVSSVTDHVQKELYRTWRWRVTREGEVYCVISNSDHNMSETTVCRQTKNQKLKVAEEFSSIFQYIKLGILLYSSPYAEFNRIDLNWLSRDRNVSKCDITIVIQTHQCLIFLKNSLIQTKCDSRKCIINGLAIQYQRYLNCRLYQLQSIPAPIIGSTHPTDN